MTHTQTPQTQTVRTVNYNAKGQRVASQKVSQRTTLGALVSMPACTLYTVCTLVTGVLYVLGHM